MIGEMNRVVTVDTGETQVDFTPNQALSGGQVSLGGTDFNTATVSFRPLGGAPGETETVDLTDVSGRTLLLDDALRVGSLTVGGLVAGNTVAFYQGG